MTVGNGGDLGAVASCDCTVEIVRGIVSFVAAISVLLVICLVRQTSDKKIIFLGPNLHNLT